MKNKKNSQFSTLNSQLPRGFTLIEMIVVVGAIGLLLPLLFSIIFAIVRQQIAVYRLATVKREGDATINIMETKIKNDAYGIYVDPNLTDGTLDPSAQICVDAGDQSSPFTDGNNFYFKDKQDDWFQFRRDPIANKIVSDSVAAGPQNLVSGRVLITSFSIECNKPADFSTPSITLSFTVSFNTPENKPALPYQLTVKLRNE